MPCYDSERHSFYEAEDKKILKIKKVAFFDDLFSVAGKHFLTRCKYESTSLTFL